jgi:MFS family permease
MVPARDPTVRNVLSVVGPELLWGFGSALTIEWPMPAAFAQHLGAGEWFLGAWGLVFALGTASAVLVTGWFVPSLPKKRGLVAWGHAVTGLLYLPVGLLPQWLAPLGPEAAQIATLCGYGVFVLSLGFLLPAWVGLIGELFPEASRTRVLGLVFLTNRVGGILGGIAAARLLKLDWHGSDLWTLLWGLAAAASALGSLPLLGVVEPPVERRARAPFLVHLKGIAHTLAELPALKRFIGMDLLAVAGLVTVSFYGDVALRERRIDTHWAGGWILVTAIAQVVGAALVTWWGGRVTPRRFLALGALCITGAALVTCVAESPWGFAAVAVLCGLYLVGRQTCHGAHVMRLARGHEPTQPLALAMASSAALGGLYPLVAGFLLPVTGFPPVFVASALVTAAAAVLLLRAPSAPARALEETAPASVTAP